MDEVDDRLLRRADKPCRTHDDLNDVDRSPGALVELDTETAGEMVDNQVTAVERLQQQDLSDRCLRCGWRSSEHQQARQRASHTVTNAAHLTTDTALRQSSLG